MLLKNYTQSRANKLVRLSVTPITEPFNIKILWLQGLSFDNGKKIISLKKHRHSFFEAHFVFSGETSYSTTGKSIRLSCGNALVFSPKTEHTVNSFSDDLIKFSLAFTLDENSEVCKKLSSFPFISLKTDGVIQSCIDDILAEADKKSVFSLPIIKNRVFDIICTIIRSCDISEPASDSAATGDNTRIAIVKQYIKDNKNLLLTCRDVAEQCHYNVQYLNRIFKEHTGETLLEYIHKTKIKDIERLLENEDYSLNRISRMLGFANEYYFNSFFKRYSGISPGLYRKMLKK